MTIFLSGPMGAGKTTLARALGRDAGARVVDLDEAIEAREGASGAQLFHARGEPAFRTLERAVALELAAGGYDVIALGGGTVTDRATRRALLREGTLITLSAPLEVLTTRIGAGTARPLLITPDGDRRAALARLVEARADAYAECHATLDTSVLDEAEVVRAIREVAHARPIVVPLGSRSYRVFVGSGTRAQLGAELAHLRPSRVVLVTDENARAHAAALRALAEGATEVVLAPGETHKTLAAVESIWNAALTARIDRDALVLAVGGGVVGDLAGFAAATLLRGVSFAQIPTTLLAMVDASVGGKTGFDRPEGKNLIGAFHQPRFVICDLEALATLSERDYVSGLAEIVKAAWLAGEEDVAALERDAPLLRSRRADAIEPALRRAVATKIAIVSDDERETGIRAHLNLGHTLGHAIEAASGYARTHGECVALGMIAAMRIGAALGDARAEDVDRVTRLLAALELPTDLDAALDDARVVSFLASDKKRAAAGVRFVVPGSPGSVRIERLTPERIVTLARR